MTRRKLKLTYLDYVIIALCASFIVSLISRYAQSKSDELSASETVAEVFFELRMAQSELADIFSVDSRIFLDSGDFLGEVRAEDTALVPAEKFVSDLNGVISRTESKLLYDISCVMLVSGSKNEGGFFAEGRTYIAPNMTLRVKNSLADLEIFITEVRVL